MSLVDLHEEQIKREASFALRLEMCRFSDPERDAMAEWIWQLVKRECDAQCKNCWATNI